MFCNMQYINLKSDKGTSLFVHMIIEFYICIDFLKQLLIVIFWLHFTSLLAWMVSADTLFNC